MKQGFRVGGIIPAGRSEPKIEGPVRAGHLDARIVQEPRDNLTFGRKDPPAFFDVVLVGPGGGCCGLDKV